MCHVQSGLNDFARLIISSRTILLLTYILEKILQCLDARWILKFQDYQVLLCLRRMMNFFLVFQRSPHQQCCHPQHSSMWKLGITCRVRHLCPCAWASICLSIISNYCWPPTETTRMQFLFCMLSQWRQISNNKTAHQTRPWFFVGQKWRLFKDQNRFWKNNIRLQVPFWYLRKEAFMLNCSDQLIGWC